MTKNTDLDIYGVPEEDLLHFPEGLLGIEDLKQYLLVTPEENLPFKYLQSVGEESLAFAVINPYDYLPGYSFDIYDDVIEKLDIHTPSDVLVLCVAVIPPDIEKMTANFAAPILINIHNKKGMQIILQDARYQIRTPIFDAFQHLHGQEAKKC